MNTIFSYICPTLYKLLSHTIHFIQKMIIGDKIRNLRSLKGISQENMADALKMSLPAYGDIERNKKDVTLSRLDQIAKVLSVTVADILAFNDRVSNF
jgi:transcriptional regulator with XRE-family HTH domain